MMTLLRKIRQNQSVMLLLGASLIVLVLALIVNQPGQRIDATQGTATIMFRADRQMLTSPGACTTLHWDMDGIREAYLNDEGVAGHDSREVCVQSNSTFVLHVILPDNTVYDYSLSIGTLTSSPLLLLMVLAALTLTASAGYLVMGRWVQAHATWAGKALKRTVRVLAIPAVSVLVTLLALEIGLRVYFTYFGTEDDRVNYVYSATDLASKTSRFVGLPYIGYAPSPFFPGDNRFGYRGAEVAIPKPAGIFRIVSIGASTTYGFGVEANQAYPAQLQDILRQQYGYSNVEVVNAGVMGYTSWEDEVNMAFRVLELQPDMVIFYEAVNDVEARQEDPGCFNGIQPLRGLTTFHGLWKTHLDDLSPSALYRFIAIRLGWMTSPTALDFAFSKPEIMALCASKTPIKPEDAIAKNSSIYYERNLRSIIAIAQANHIQVLISRWIYPTVQYKSDALPQYMQDAVEENNGIAKRLAEEMHTYYYDLAADFKYQVGLWWSPVHMNAKGLQQQASLYAAYLVKNGILPKPPKDF